MSKRLPAKPHIDNLKKQAKRFHQAVLKSQAQAVDRVREFHYRYKNRPPATFSLREAQHVIAQEYGFADWIQLADAVRHRQDASRGNETVYTDGVVQATRYAGAEANSRGHSAWGVEHLLLGLLQDVERPEGDIYSKRA